jgi:diguanylate cyclase (GGDEF)-like protein
MGSGKAAAGAKLARRKRGRSMGMSTAVEAGVAAGARAPRQTERSYNIQHQLDSLGSRDLQLWSIGLLIIVVLAAGFAALVAPNLVWRASVGELHVQQRYLPQLFYGLISLVLLFNAYIVLQRRTLNATRAALIRELAFGDRLETLSLIDPATQLFTRGAMEQFASHEIARANRSGCNLTFLLIRLESLKHPGLSGAEAAERLAGEASQLMKATFRGSDILFRYDCDQYLVLMPDTNHQQARRAMKRLRDRVDQWNLGNAELQMAVAFGAAEHKSGAALAAMLAEAEEHLKSGRGERAN